MAILTFQGTLSPAIVAANTSAEQSFVVGPGAFNPLGGFVGVSKPTAQAGLAIGGCRIIDATHIGIVFNNDTAAGITPTAGEVYQFLLSTD